MFKRMTTGDIAVHILIVILMIGLMIVTLYPFYYVLMGSFSDGQLLTKHTGILLVPQGFSVASYREVFRYRMIWTSYGNTVFYVVAGTLVNIVITALGAFALSRQGLKGAGVIMKLVTLTMFLNGGLVPTYLVVNSLGMVDTRWSMLIPGAVNVFNFIILRTAFQSVPQTLEEAAQIDGANYWYIFYRVIIPLAMPSLMVIMLYYAVDHWNAYFGALIYIRSNALYPLQIVLRNILTSVGGGGQRLAGDDTFANQDLMQTVKYAIIIVATLPIIMVYPFIQRYFVAGVMIGSIKG